MTRTRFALTMAALVYGAAGPLVFFAVPRLRAPWPFAAVMLVAAVAAVLTPWYVARTKRPFCRSARGRLYRHVLTATIGMEVIGLLGIGVGALVLGSGLLPAF